MAATYSEKRRGEGGRHETMAARGSVRAFRGIAQAQQFPTRPVTLIVPWPPGGSTDIGMRALARATEKHLGQSIVIENRPGAPARSARQHGGDARPDGYTVAQLPITCSASASSRRPLRSREGFHLHHPSHRLHVRRRWCAPMRRGRRSTTDRLRQANPGKVNYGTPGAGSSLHITMEQIAKQKGIKWTQVPFKGGADNMNALLGGHIDVTADSTGWAELVNAGKFRLLVTWGAQRTKNWPNVPTLKEIGIDMVSNSPFGIGGPKGMDPAVVKVLHDAFKKGMEEQSYKDTMLKLDMEPITSARPTITPMRCSRSASRSSWSRNWGLRQQ
jgi:tripartite-type tricarboxylate transporter receptor subunit TctC